MGLPFADGSRDTNSANRGGNRHRFSIPYPTPTTSFLTQSKKVQKVKFIYFIAHFALYYKSNAKIPDGSPRQHGFLIAISTDAGVSVHAKRRRTFFGLR